MILHPKQAFIGAGANLGDRWQTLHAALAALAGSPRIIACEISPVYETDPVGVTDQPKFLNLAVGVETTLSPDALLALLLELEKKAGRDRANEKRWGPRVLDLDLLLYEGEKRALKGFTLPHPRLWERPFVTVPLRALLTHSARFHHAVWESLCQDLDKLPPEPPGVVPAEPPPGWMSPSA